MFNHRRHSPHQEFLRGGRRKCRESSSAKGTSYLRGPWTWFQEKFFCLRGVGVYSLKYGKKSLEDKNISNKIILIGFFLKIKGKFSFIDVQKRKSFTPDDNLLYSHHATPLAVKAVLHGSISNNTY